MKTNVTLISKSRELFNVTIRQQTKNGFLNLSDLEKAYANSRIGTEFKDRGRFQDLLSQKENVERLYFVLKETGKINSEMSEFIEKAHSVGSIKLLKELGLYETRGARENKTVWCDKHVWILVAMEMSPMLYAKAVVWLGDQLIPNRIDAGDMYKGLSAAASKLQGVDYPRLAQALNYIVFGRHETGIRNTGSEAELSALYLLESNLAFSIDSGFLPTFSHVIEHLRNIWSKKYYPLHP